VFYQAIVDNLEKYDFLKIIQNFSTKCFGVFCHSCRRIYIQPDILTSLKFYKTIVDKYLGRIKHYLMINKKNLNINRNIFQDYSKDNPYTHIERSTIVGMTTICASRYHSIIKDIAPSVLIVEEAAMVFESHVVALLNKNIQHLLLIGDHKQLKALSKIHEFCVDYKIDKSLFERLINNDYPKIMLNCQHRWNPALSWILKHFYGETIIDHPSVLKIEPIRGISKNIFFVNHHREEEPVDFSKKNVHEIKYLVNLALFLLKNGYSEKEITILCLYGGQAKSINEALKSFNLKQLRVSSSDNYQGEENEIILVSFVRSQSLGFMKVPNRVCVALTRAKKAMYCIGNFEMYAKNSPLWKSIIDEAKERKVFGIGLPLCCKPEHTASDILAIVPDDFNKRPFGGCDDKEHNCVYRFQCGHTCKRPCHLSDHTKLKCNDVCKKPISYSNQKSCEHECRQPCGHSGDCSICLEIADKQINGDCGHVIPFRCDKIAYQKDCSCKSQ
jgi:hypothetical protein